MILQALNRYYEILLEDPDSGIAPLGYSAVGVNFALNLSATGELMDIFPLFSVDEKNREKSLRMVVPAQVKRSGISPKPNFLWDNSAFVLGLSDNLEKDPEYGIKRFEAFRQFNLELLEQADCPAARVVSAFLNQHDPQNARTQTAIVPHLEKLLKGGNVIFRYQDKPVHHDPVIRNIWETYLAGKEAVKGQCLVTGKFAPIARLHPSIQGIRGANAVGASLVGFNDRAYESFNRIKAQGLNAPVSEQATAAYSIVLNHLLSSTNPNKKFYLGDATVVYWAESTNARYANTFASLFAPEFMDEVTAEGANQRQKANERLQEVADKVKNVHALDLDRVLEGLDPTTRFYVLGLSPNAARISIRFFLTDAFGKFIERIMRHYQDLAIIKEYPNQPTYISVRAILDETVPKKSSNKEVMPLMAGAVMRAILLDQPYPAALYLSILNRIRAEADDPARKKIGYCRAAVIKAYLLRKFRHTAHKPFQEVLTMALNTASTIPAYVLGRLFAVLEKVQQEAIGEVNASIKDRYFTSACASPASVFPVLLRLSQHHISKAEYGYVSDRRIQDILGLLDIEKNPIPARLNLDEQGVFILGYYHQRADLYTSKKEKEEPAAL